MKRLILLLFFLTSCGPAYHLRKAIDKGAKVTHDTSMLTVRFSHKGPDGTLDLNPLFRPGSYSRILVDTTIYKDSIIWKVRNNTVEADCPDVEEEKEVPCITNTTIQAGYTKWQLIGSTLGGILFSLAMAFGAYKFAGLIQKGSKTG